MGNSRHQQPEWTDESLSQLNLSIHNYFPKQEDVAAPSKVSPRVIPVRYKNFGQISMSDYEVLASIPEHPFWSRVERLIDFSFADRLCAPLYSTRGQRPYAPSFKLKVHLVQRYYGWSDRQMENEMIYNLAIKRFLHVPISFKGLDHSTVALDRDRLGSVLFDACHHVILAQIRAHGLWGNESDELWLIDSFHSYAHVQQRGTVGLIQQAALQVLKHLERNHNDLYTWLILQFPKESWSNYPADEKAFSKLVAQCYSLMMWLENGPLHDLFWSWSDKQHQLRSLELQAVLCQILNQYTRPVSPTDKPKKEKKNKPQESTDEPKEATDKPQESTDEPKEAADKPQESTDEPKEAADKPQESTDEPKEAAQSQTDGEPEYERIPRKQRSTNRIVSASDPDVRIGHKSPKKTFLGDKSQVVASAQNGIVLDIEEIAGTEQDGHRMVEMTDRIQNLHSVKLKRIAGDSAYGIGRNRKAMEARHVQLTAPLRAPNNKKGLFNNRQFKYDAETQTVTCPNNQTTSKKARNKQEEGDQYTFDAKQCQACPLKAQCTTAAKRTLFISDYYEQHQRAAAHNETEAAKKDLQARKEIERLNNEAKNIIGMKYSWEKSREKRRIQGKLCAMVINIRITVRKLCSPIEPLRRRRALSCM